ncbi:hypothetical protein PCAR4_1230032 [Paraburkholderia caribensis]|jgi:hypothetical protein|nr:hypothetical protein PCAR4_1230032 [Paraburkholderia caribensis]
MLTILPLCYSRESFFNHFYRRFGFPSNFVFYQFNQSFARELIGVERHDTLLFPPMWHAFRFRERSL